MVDGKVLVQSMGRTGSQRGEAGQPRGGFPTVATAPDPQDATGSAAGVPGERDSRGGGTEEAVQAVQAGVGRGGAGLINKVGFPTVAPPAPTAAALRARQRARINAIREVDPGQWALQVSRIPG